MPFTTYSTTKETISNIMLQPAIPEKDIKNIVGRTAARKIIETKGREFDIILILAPTSDWELKTFEYYCIATSPTHNKHKIIILNLDKTMETIKSLTHILTIEKPQNLLLLAGPTPYNNVLENTKHAQKLIYSHIL